MRYLAVIPILIMTSLACSAREVAPSPPVDPEKQALVYQVREYTEGKTQALTGVFALQAQVEDLKAKLAAETKRADEAEARTKASAEGK